VEDQWSDVAPSKVIDHSVAGKKAKETLGSAGFGDTGEKAKSAGLASESVEYELDSAELAEAIRDIRKESIRNKMRKLKEASDGREAKSWEDAEPEGGEDESHENLEESVNMMNEEDLVEDVADLVLNIDLPPEVERELAQLGLDEDDIEVGVELNIDDLDQMDDDEEVEIVDDEDDMDLDDESVDMVGSREEDLVLVDDADESEELEEGMMSLAKESKQRKARSMVIEKRLARLEKMLEEKEKEVSGLKNQLVETNLFTAKAVYYSKFLQRALTDKTLGKQALQQIVEQLDKGSTVAETKAIYKQIEQKLNEHKNASRKLDGSSSKVTKPGGVQLTEGVLPQAGNDPNGQTSDRWKELAGLSRNGK
jgi:hypothetical protein